MKRTLELFQHRYGFHRVVDLSPFLEQAHPLTSAIRAPQITSARAIVAAVVRSVITIATPSDTRPSEKVN